MSGLRRRDVRARVAKAEPYLVFRVGAETFGVPAGVVVAVADVDRLTVIPCHDPALLGVTRHRETVLPIVDVRRRLTEGAAPAPVGRPPFRCVIVRTTSGELMCAVDVVVGLTSASPGEVPPGVTLFDPERLTAPTGAHRKQGA